MDEFIKNSEGKKATIAYYERIRREQKKAGTYNPYLNSNDGTEFASRINSKTVINNKKVLPDDSKKFKNGFY